MITIAHNATVLVVEDEGLVRLDTVDTLRDAGFKVVEAADASEALDIVAVRDDIDMLFTDINMPGSMDGLELARLVHARHPSMRLLLTSGIVRPTTGEMPDDGQFLSKPYTPEAMRQAVTATLALD